MRSHAPWAAMLACAALVGCQSDAGEGHDEDAASDGTASGAPGDDAPSPTTTGTSDEPETGTSDDTGAAEPPPAEPWVWSLPSGFPEPYVPPDNPMSAAKVELGRHLFYDERLSVDGTYSCATCHRQELAFTDGLPRSEGVTGQLHPRGAMSLVNVAYASSLAWGDPTLLDLETHAQGPMFGTSPVELGLVDEADALARIADDPTYDALFAAAFPGDDEPLTLDHVVKAIASFERTIISGRSPFDRFFFDGDETAISDAAKRGWELFNFPGQCTYCHFGFDYSDSTYFAALPERTLAFHNTGLYDVDGQGAYPAGNEGLYRFTGDPADMGKFKSPTLRNITVTGPYMHDGSIATLAEVLAHYAQGGRAGSPLVDFQVKTFELKPGMVADFMAFFESLTDESVLTDPALGDPWAR